MGDVWQFPVDLYYAIEPQTWARPEGDGTVTVGITALGIRLSGEVYMCRAKPLGQPVEVGRSVAVVELAKAIVSVKSPVTGTVVAHNPLLEDTPEWVHREPYGRGWVARLAVADWAADAAALLHDAVAVAEAMRRHAWLHGQDAQEGG